MAKKFFEARGQILAITILSLLTACGPDPQEMLPGLHEEADQFAKQLYSGQGTPNEMKEKLLPELTRKIGGEEAIGSYLRSVYRDVSSLQREGFRNVSLSAASPTVPVKVGRKWVSLVPVWLRFRYDDGGNVAKMRLFGPTAAYVNLHLVAVSSDGGKSWRFAEAKDAASVEALVPGIRNKIVFPRELMTIQTN